MIWDVSFLILVGAIMGMVIFAICVGVAGAVFYGLQQIEPLVLHLLRDGKER